MAEPNQTESPQSCDTQVPNPESQQHCSPPVLETHLSVEVTTPDTVDSPVVTFNDNCNDHQLTPKAVPPRQRASMLPKPEVGPKPSFLRQSPNRKLPLSSGPSSLSIMSTSLPSPFASPSDASDSSRNVWGHRGSFGDSSNNSRLSPGTPSSTSSTSSCGSPLKASPPSPNSKIPVNTQLLSLSPSLSSMSHSMILDPSVKSCSRHCNATVIDVNASLPRSGNLSKLTAKASGTASMLRSTLRRMTRLAVSSTTHLNTLDKPQTPLSHQQVTTPSPIRGGSPKHEAVVQSPSPNNRKLLGLTPKSTSPTSPGVSNIQRSRSFRDAVNYGTTDTWGPKSGTASQYGPSSISTVQHYRSNSLRRSVRNKDMIQQTQTTGSSQTMRASVGLQRSGTGGTLDRNNVRRSNSMAGSNGKRLRDQHVRKSRGVQTLLTKDIMDDDLGEPGVDNMNPSTVEFTVYLPDLLDSGGGADQGVETHIIEPTEPIDVRRNRQLTLDNMRLNRELDKLKSQLAETDAIKRELKISKSKLEEEQKTRIRIEQQLDQHNEKVLLIAKSMDTVEREFEHRDLHIANLEAKLSKAEADLKLSNDVVIGQKNEIEQSLILQKTLLMQYQESQYESKELQEFLQAEKYTLAETLKDCESEMSELKAEISRKAGEVMAVEERCGHLVRLGEQRHQEIRMLKSQLKGLEDRAKSTILAQGAELSTAHVILSELLTKLRIEYPGAEIIEAPPVKSSSGFGLTEKLKSLGRSLMSRPEKEVQVEPQDDDLLSGCLLNDPTLQNLSEAIKKRQISEELNNGFPDIFGDSIEDETPGLDTKLEQLKLYIEKLINDLKNKTNLVNGSCSNGSNSPEKNGNKENGHSHNGTVNGNHSTDAIYQDDLFDLNSTLDTKEKKEDLISRFLRHRQILIQNYEQAEKEIERVDEIYHETIKRVLKVLDSLPLETKTLPELLKLKVYLEEENQETGSTIRLNRNGDSKPSKSEIIQTSIEPVMAGKRQMIQLTETALPVLNQSL